MSEVSVLFGNLTVDELEERTGWKFSDREKSWLNEHRQDNATIKYGDEKFHIFDLPLTIHCDSLIFKELFTILFNQKTPIEHINISEITETEEQKKQKELKQEEQDKKENPNSIWNIKWHMCVPVIVEEHNMKVGCYFSCFINTYTTGWNNIPNMVYGTGWIESDEQGLHGRFTLTDPEIYDDANKHPEWNYVIGTGFKRENLDGYVSDHEYKNRIFEKVEFNLEDAIKEYERLTGSTLKEIHYDGIKGKV